jgi:hypothetical protein
MAAAGTLPAAALVVACGIQAGGQGPAKPAALNTGATLQVLIDLGAALFPAFDGGVITQWKAAHPQGPKVEWAAATGGTREMIGKIQAGLAAGTPVDLV